MSDIDKNDWENQIKPVEWHKDHILHTVFVTCHKYLDTNESWSVFYVFLDFLDLTHN